MFYEGCFYFELTKVSSIHFFKTGFIKESYTVLFRKCESRLFVTFCENVISGSECVCTLDISVLLVIIVKVCLLSHWCCISRRTRTPYLVWKTAFWSLKNVKNGRKHLSKRCEMPMMVWDKGETIHAGGRAPITLFFEVIWGSSSVSPTY